MKSQKSSSCLTFSVLLLFYFRTTKAFSTEGSSGVNIVCSVLDNVDWSSIGKVYRCQNTNINNSDLIVLVNNAEVTSITHSNNGSAVETANEIEMLDMRHMTINFLPNKMKVKLPKLKAIIFWNVRLISLNKEIMEQLGDSLEYANFENNQLTSLDGDLFKYNLKMKYVSFSFNPIKYIDPKFFETFKNMKFLEIVDLYSLGCMSQIINKFGKKDIATFKRTNRGCYGETTSNKS